MDQGKGQGPAQNEIVLHRIWMAAGRYPALARPRPFIVHVRIPDINMKTVQAADMIIIFITLTFSPRYIFLMFKKVNCIPKKSAIY